MSTETAPAVKEEKTPRTIRDYLSGEEMKKQFALALPKHISPDRFVRIALTAMTKTPKLAQCDQGSFFGALLTLSQLGLEPDGRLAHLIPFNNKKRNVVECQLIVDYKGLVELAMRSDKIANIHADKVCDKDVFVYNVGVVERHEIDFKTPRGEAYAYYAQVTFKDGTKKADVMPLEDVQKIQKRSRAGGDGPWITDFHEMAKKTVFRRLSKWLPMSAEYRDALAADADAIEEARFKNALPAAATAIPNFGEIGVGDGGKTTAPEAPEGNEGDKEPSGAEGSPEGETPLSIQEMLSVALAELNFDEERFIKGLRLLEVPNIAKQATKVRELTDAVCDQAFKEGLNDLVAAIEGVEAKRK